VEGVWLKLAYEPATIVSLPAGVHRCPVHHAGSEDNNLARSNDYKEIFFLV